MSDQNNTSFAHAFLPGLILGLIVGAVAGAFVPDMMTANSMKPVQSGEVQPRDGGLEDSADDLLNDAENA
ncbi:MAG: hypothetical protein JJ974_12800, partial [Phycisphaerales bacterium]|nr:hypothetical protein [Phycisphaerales bacterium]